MNPAGQRFRVGRFDCLIVKDGTESRPPVSQYVDEIPDELTSHALYMLGGMMLVDTPDARILIDAGNGPHRGSRSHAAEATFEAEGIEPTSIDTILLTHGDPDHIGGLLAEDREPAFPNASYVLHRDLWDAWHALRGSDLYFPEQEGFVRRLAGLLEGRCTTFDQEREVLPGIRAIPALGHRTGHTAYLLQSEGAKLLHIGDAAFDPIFLEYTDVLNAHDTEPEVAREARRSLVERAVAEGAMVVGSHFGVDNVGKLRQINQDRFAWTPVALS